MKFIISAIVCFCTNFVYAQELYVYTEPASNVPANSLGVRLTQQWVLGQVPDGIGHQVAPELVWGVSSKWMLHSEFFFNKRNNNLRAEGASLYTKYRFYSEDDVHKHFRMAAFARMAYNSGVIMQPSIELNGGNSGYEAGIIATKLVNRVALSGSASFIHATNNRPSEKYRMNDVHRNAMAYSLSVGKLLLPTEYNSYDQTNLNLMFEFLGQSNFGSGYSYIDAAPSLQLIFKSRMRLDLGYRFALINELKRPVPGMFLLRFEYNLFNLFSK